jgi:hypothetical protein
LKVEKPNCPTLKTLLLFRGLDLHLHLLMLPSAYPRCGTDLLPFSSLLKVAKREKVCKKTRTFQQEEKEEEN